MQCIPREFVAVIDRNAQALKKSSLEYSRFATGFFMAYWGMPHIPSNLKPHTWGIEVANKRTVVTGTGNDLFSITYSVDLAKFMVRFLDTNNWPKFSVVCGSDVTFNELINTAEKVRASRFRVVYDNEAKFQKNEATLLLPDGIPVVPEKVAKTMVAANGLMIISGLCRLPTENRLDGELPDIHATTVEELLTKAWLGK
ncbi:hypothetical protein BBP40_010732 [Aspergillus hancockii]|nr:hypothetical protein BBP40_010732 [Aspergillus hancockii]